MFIFFVLTKVPDINRKLDPKMVSSLCTHVLIGYAQVNNNSELVHVDAIKILCKFIFTSYEHDKLIYCDNTRKKF